MITGILVGLLAAACQSVCYLLSRRYVVRPGHDSRELFALTHVWMGVLALMLAPVLWSPAAPPVTTYVWPLLAAAGFYLWGQTALFQVLRHAPASRVSPLLGLKILLLAGIAAGAAQVPAIQQMLVLRPVAALQWVAVFASVVAALMLNEAGGRLTPRAAGWILFACVGYVLSDLSIVVLVDRLSVMGQPRGSWYGCCLTYVFTGCIGLAVLPRGCVADRAKRRAALPVALSWLLAMGLLYLSFKMLGVLFGNIVQATRGLMSIGLGALVAHWQFHHLESHVPRAVLGRRVAAAVLMFLAIVLFLTTRYRGI
ncbi:hypothetical protein HQ590_05475 [bacterium]|nr:hypothetical protein [bacterium]